MRKATWVITGIAVCLAVGSNAAPELAYAQYSSGQSANECLSVSARGIENGCSYEIEVAWCLYNVDCRGQYSNQFTILPGGYYAFSGRQSGNQLRYAACRGRNSIHSLPGYRSSCS